MKNRFLNVGQGISVKIQKPCNGIILNNPIIEANNRIYSLLEASVQDKKGEISIEKLNQALIPVAANGGLHGHPQNLVFIIKGDIPITAGINYWKEDDSNGVTASISSYSSWDTCPSLDVLLTRLTKSYDPGDVAPILIVDPSIKLKPYGQNGVDDTVERIDGNPFPELEKFVGKIYDGSLNVPELEKFIGYRFGWKGDNTAYIFGAKHRGKDLGLTGFRSRLFKIGEKFDTSNSDWEIQAIEHDKIEKENDYEKNGRKEFTQHINLILKHLKYNPPLAPSELRNKIIEDDKLFWLRATAMNGYDIKEIEPQYTDKDTLTPWYEATHLRSGKKLIVGSRWRVYSIGKDLGGYGEHISKSEPEKVYALLAKLI
jgi:hypothetical protein